MDLLKWNDGAAFTCQSMPRIRDKTLYYGQNTCEANPLLKIVVYCLGGSTHSLTKRIWGDFGLLIQNFRAILHVTTHICCLWVLYTARTQPTVVRFTQNKNNTHTSIK